jgi:diguanylate cyclase
MSPLHERRRPALERKIPVKHRATRQARTSLELRASTCCVVGLVRSTLAAEGTDRTVDQCMKEMREVVRTDDMDAALAALLPRLEKAVLDSEQRRETRVDQISVRAERLGHAVAGPALAPRRQRPLKSFAKQFDSRVGQAREIPLLLSELSGLQGQALSNLESDDEPARPGLLQRLFGGKEAGTEVAPVEPAVSPPSRQPPAVAASPATPVVEDAPELAQALRAFAPQAQAPQQPVLEVAPAPAPQPVAPRVDVDECVASVPEVGAPRLSPVETLAVAIETPEPPRPVEVSLAPLPERAVAAVVVAPEVLPLVPQPTEIGSLSLPPVLDDESAEVDPEALYALPDSPEPSYSSVAKHIEDTLLGLLGDLALPERHRPQAQAMRERLAQGLNWYELLPILDDLAVLMLAITDSGQHEFEAYLKHLNERLEAFQSNLQAASDGHADRGSAAREMDTQIREQIDGLQSSVQEAADLDDLKQVLESHLEGLLGAMDQHQQAA